MSKHVTKKMVYVLNYVHENDSQHFVHVFNLLDKMTKNLGWQISILSEKGGVGTRTIFGKKVRYLSNNGSAGRYINLAWQLIKARKSGTKLVFVRIALPPAIVAIFVGRLLGIKTVYWQSSANFDIDTKKKFFGRQVGGKMMALVSRYVDCFVTGPEAMVEYYHRCYGVERSRLRLLYNDVDTYRFVPGDGEARESGVLKVLFVHSFSPSKNAVKYLPAMIDAMNAVTTMDGVSIEFDLVGDGPERGDVERIIQAASPGVRVRLLGALPNTALPARYAQSDLFVMPSYREGMPRALMEAMAAALPVVSTDAGGTRDVVGPLQSEFIVSRDDVDGFARTLTVLLRDGDLRRRVGAENRQHIQKYSTEAVAGMYDKLLTGMLA